MEAVCTIVGGYYVNIVSIGQNLGKFVDNSAFGI